MFKSIRSKLVVFAISMVIVAVVPVDIAVHILINNYVMDSHKDNVANQINTIEQALDVFYDGLDRNIDYFAGHSLLKQADSTITSYYNGYDGTAPMTPSKNGGIEQKIYEAFDIYAKSHPGTMYVYMGTEDGGYIQWPETKTSKNYDPRKRPWYPKAFDKNGKIFRTDPYTDAVTGSVIVSNARQFSDKTGKPYGVMAIDASSDKLANIMEKIKIGKTGYAMMLHKKGLILADPRHKENNLKYAKDVGIEKLETVLDHKQTSFETRIKGIVYQVDSFQSDMSDWVVVALIKKEELDQLSFEIRTYVLGISLLVLSCAGLLGWLVSGRFVRPSTSWSQD